MISIGIDSKGFKDASKSIAGLPTSLQKISARAINKTLVSLRVEMNRTIREEVNLKARDVRDELQIKKASWTDLTGQIIGSGSPGIQLFKYVRGSRKAPSTIRLKSTGGYKPAKGISVEIFKARGKKIVSGGFIAQMGSGHIGVFKRTGGIAVSGRPEIEERFGPSPTKILSSDYFDDKFETYAEEVLAKNFEHEADYELQKI